MENNRKKYKYAYVILIDDMDLDNFVNEMLMTIHRFSEKIDTYTNPEAALKLLIDLAKNDTAGPRPEMIFIDINMPVLDGFELIKAFKPHIHAQQSWQPKLVILTSSLFQTDLQKVLEIDKDIRVINKPLTEEMLCSI